MKVVIDGIEYVPYDRLGKNGIICPECGAANNSEVTDSRPREKGLYRRRKCICGYRWSTLEVLYEIERNCH